MNKVPLYLFKTIHCMRQGKYVRLVDKKSEM